MASGDESERFISSHFPYLPITLRIQTREETSEALLDTGFDGDLIITPGLLTNESPPDSYLRWTLADGSTVLAPSYLGRIEVANFGAVGTFAAVISVMGDETILGRSLSNRFSITLDHGRRVIVAP